MAKDRDAATGAMHREQASSCLALGTLVETPSGAKAIEALRVGDNVWGFNIERHEPVVAKIDSLVPTKASEMIRIGALRVTLDHPVYVKGQWKPAGKLQPSDLLLTKELTERAAGPPQTVSGDSNVYDIRVDGPNNFFAGGVLVHNKTERL